MSDLLKQTLTSHAVGATTQVMEVPVEQLERMSGKVRILTLNAPGSVLTRPV